MSSTPFRQRLVLQLLAKRSQARTAAAKGFTLIELLVVIAILGVLGSVGFQAYLSQIASAYSAQAANTATAMAKNCAALQTTGEEDAWQTLTDDSYDVATVTVAGTCNGLGAVTTIAVTVGQGTTTRTATATVTAQGVVTPAPVPTA